MKKKTYTVTRVELGFVEATSLEEAIETSENGGFICGNSSEKIIDSKSEDNDFWANLNTSRIEYLKKYFSFRKYIESNRRINYKIHKIRDDYFINDLIKLENFKIDSKSYNSYEITDKNDCINDILNFIGETDIDRSLMIEELKSLLFIKEDYIFSSRIHNKYITSNDFSFNKICQDLIKKNKKH